MRRKIFGLAMSFILSAALMTGCGSNNSTNSNAGNSSQSATSSEEAGGGFDTSQTISVISREDGSGTRGAFVELMGIEEDDVDNTTEEAVITNSTAVMLTTVAGNPAAIGYVSLGSLDDSVKALKVNGVDATAENVANSTYSVARPFNIAVKDDISDAANDFISYIMSADGQQVIEDNGYIKVSDAAAYTASDVSGTVTISGSSSVTPVMEKLKEAYQAVNANVDIQIQESDSSTGMADAISGTSDIGMASRDLKDTEISQGITGTEIAKDGIAVIVNQSNSLEDITSDQVKDIFIGAVTTWSEIEG